jgi:hypothetical protein
MNVKEFATVHNVSTRTAGRYIKAGKLPPPPESRKQGNDGKFYPVKITTTRSALYLPLIITRSNVKRIGKAKTITDNELELLRQIVYTVTTIFENLEYKKRAGKF